MSEYKAPLRDMQFVLKELAGLDEIAKLPGCEEVTPELVGQILEEAAKFASGVLSPLNKPADEELGHQEHRNAAHALGRVRRTREHHVNDVLGEIVLAVSDKDLLPVDAVVVSVLVVPGAHGARLHQA